MEKFILGYDIGGTKIGIGLASDAGKIIGKRRIENVNTDPAEILPLLAQAGRELAAENGMKISDIAGFGISAPGPADILNGILTAPPNNPKWRNVPIQKYLEDDLGIPGCFENDANSAALAEWFFGAGRGVEDFIYLTMSTGIGAGIVAANTLVRGTAFYGGEVGHMPLEIKDAPRKCGCGHYGCYEAYCGGRSIALYLQDLLKDKPDHPIVQFAGSVEKIDMIALEKAVRAGDPLALEVWEEMSLRNAQALAILMQTFNTRRIILGTLAWAIGDLYTEPIKKHLARFAWKEMLESCEIVNSELKRDIGYYAGVSAAMYFLLGKRAS